MHFPPDPKVDLKYNKFWNDLGPYKVPLNPYILCWSIDEYNSKALKINDGRALNGHFSQPTHFLLDMKNYISANSNHFSSHLPRKFASNSLSK